MASKTLTGPFAYSILKKQTHIQILHLEPGGRDNPLRCSIVHVDLDSKPQFSAISYMWSKPEKLSRILVGDDAYNTLDRNGKDIL